MRYTDTGFPLQAKKYPTAPIRVIRHQTRPRPGNGDSGPTARAVAGMVTLDAKVGEARLPVLLLPLLPGVDVVFNVGSVDVDMLARLYAPLAAETPPPSRRYLISEGA